MKRPHNWTHSRDHFFKYMRTDTAKIVLKTGKLRWSSVRMFNDPFDMGFDLHVEYDRDRVVNAVRDNDWQAYAGLRAFQPKNEFGHLLALIRDQAPGMTREEFDLQMGDAINESLDLGAAHLPALQAYLRESTRDFKLLCLSLTPDNLLMWSHYADRHTGVVLRFTCVPEQDSAWGIAKPVQYQRSMPRLLNEAGMIRFLSGEDALDTQHVLDLSVFTKSIDWEYEQEWRVAIPFAGADTDFKDVEFHSSELMAVYFGCRISEEDRQEIEGLLNKLSPRAHIFVGDKSDREFKLEFSEVR